MSILKVLRKEMIQQSPFAVAGHVGPGKTRPTCASTDSVADEICVGTRMEGILQLARDGLSYLLRIPGRLNVRLPRRQVVGRLGAICRLAVCFLLVPMAAMAEEAVEEEEESIPFPDTHPIEWGDPEPDDRPLPELWFPVGEEIRYRVYWGRIPVGRSVATTQWVEMYGRTLLSISLRTRSNRFLDRIYPVDDVIESIIDPHTFLPLRFEINLSEGRYRKHEITKFDYERMIAYWRSETRDRERTFELEEDTRDLVSFAYYMRRVGFTPGSRQHFRVMTDEKIYDLWLEARDNTRVRLPNHGRVSSIEVEPEAAFEGLFVRRGRMTFWVSNDERRILTRMSASIPVASIRMVLQDVCGPGHDDWILGECGDDDDDDDD